MLNRRSLRIKAMQALYAYTQCKRSDYHVAMDLIEKKLTPGFEVIERPSDEVIEDNKKKAALYFKENYLKQTSSFFKEEGMEAEEAANDAINFYNAQVKKDFDFFTKNLVGDLEKVENVYLLLLLLPIEFTKRAQADDFQQEQKHIKKKLTLFGIKFTNNSIIQALSQNQTLEKEAARRNLSWSANIDRINDWYLDVIKKDEAFLKYVELEAPSVEDDKKILSHLYKNLIFKLQNFETYFEEIIVRWDEDKEIIKGMITKTLKSIDEQENYELELFTLNGNWEEEKQFFVSLFKNTIAKEDILEDVISNKAKNWDVERIAFLDKIILKLALTEMMIFPGIPVKVTINEYLEISKRYSTPKSRQFINGLLDAISNDLLSTGVIKKSGRGLIDNK